MKEQQHPTGAEMSSPEDKEILLGLMDAESYYQFFRAEVDVPHLIKLVGDKLTAGEHPRRPENQE
mgnify:CR=1 FL=1